MSALLLQSKLKSDAQSTEFLMESLVNEEQIISENREKLNQLLRSFEFLSEKKLLKYCIGGQEVSIPINLIESFVKSNFLFALMSGKYDCFLPHDSETKARFLDLDMVWVRPFINWLFDMSLWDGINEAKKPIFKHSYGTTRLQNECDCLNHFFRVSTASAPAFQNTTFQDSQILQSREDIDNSVLTPMLLEYFGNDKTLATELIYRGSRDGLEPAHFHTKCDGIAECLVVIQDTHNNVFGVFCDVPWFRGDDGGRALTFEDTKNSFFYSLVRNGSISPVKCKAKSSTRCLSSDDIVFGFDGGTNTEYYDLVIARSGQEGYLNICNAFDKFVCASRDFKVKDIEVFHVTATVNPNILTTPTLLPLMFRYQDKTSSSTLMDDSSVDNGIIKSTSFTTQLNARAKLNMEFIELALDLQRQEEQLLLDITAFRDELRFVAQFTGIQLPNHNKNAELTAFQNVMLEVEIIIQTMKEVERSYADTPLLTKDLTVTINTGGVLTTVKKSTLQLLPFGTPLTNMINEAWGHETDENGHIVQNVNSDLFVTIINHLRLRALLPSDNKEVVSAIKICSDQKSAMDNLLAFYMLSDVLLVEVVAGDGH